jgi:hypothetical protein
MKVETEMWGGWMVGKTNLMINKKADKTLSGEIADVEA